MDHTSRMVALLALMRAQQNGVIAEAMHNAGVRGALNYGVNIPTIRRIASQEPRDHDFAKFLYRQQVRELRMAAVNIACPECVTPAELDFWLSDNPTTELVEELAMRLLCHAAHIDEIVERWLIAGNQTESYTAIMTLVRAKEYNAERVLEGLMRCVMTYADDLSIARAASVLIASMSVDESRKSLIDNFLKQISECNTASARFLGEELGWLLD